MAGNTTQAETDTTRGLDEYNEPMSSKPTILVVDDEHDLADLYASWFRPDYETLVAYDGRSALETIDGEVDVMLLDRRMPDISGDEVLGRIRAAGHDCWVIMVTAVDPGLDVVELDVDDYVTKPVNRPQLTRIIDNLRTKSRFESDRRELVALSNKMETLEEEFSVEELEGTDAYERLEEALQRRTDPNSE